MNARPLLPFLGLILLLCSPTLAQDATTEPLPPLLLKPTP